MTRNGRVYIPLDVIDLILGILHSDGDKSSLSACSRVCHEFLHCCRRRLFPTIRYSGVFTLLLTFLQDSQHLRVYIRQLTLHGKYLDVSELLAIIELLPSLQDLTLSGISPYYKDDTLSKALCYSRHLKTLHLEEVIECYEDFASPEHGLDIGSVISMFPDVGDLTLSKVDSNPDDIMVDRPCIKDFRTNVERSLHSLGPKTRINPRTISISGQVFPAASLRVVSQLCFPSLDIVLDIRPQDKIPDAGKVPLIQ